MDVVFNNGYKIIKLISMANGMFGRLILMTYVMYVTCATCSFFMSTELFTILYEPVDNYLNLLYGMGQLFLLYISSTVIFYLSSIGQDLAISYRLELLYIDNRIF